MLGSLNCFYISLGIDPYQLTSVLDLVYKPQALLYILETIHRVSHRMNKDHKGRWCNVHIFLSVPALFFQLLFLYFPRVSKPFFPQPC